MEMRLIFGTFVIFIAFSSIAANKYLYRNDFEREVECTEAGFKCDGCNTSYICVPIGDGFIAEKLEDCKDGRTCLESTGRCTTDFNPNCIIDHTFVCHQRGIFPDPFQCNKYHVCCGQSPFELTTYECPEGFKYNPLNTLCDKVYDECEPLVPWCDELGKTGPIPGNPSMYYICLLSDSKLLPQLFLCPTNNIFANGKCTSPTDFTEIDVLKLI